MCFSSYGHLHSTALSLLIFFYPFGHLFPYLLISFRFLPKFLLYSFTKISRKKHLLISEVKQSSSSTSSAFSYPLILRPIPRSKHLLWPVSLEANRFLWQSSSARIYQNSPEWTLFSKSGAAWLFFLRFPFYRWVVVNYAESRLLAANLIWIQWFSTGSWKRLTR